MKPFSVSCIRPIWEKQDPLSEDNLDSLKDAVKQLKNKKELIKIKVKREQSPYKEPTYKVTDWIYRADYLAEKADQVIAEGEEEIQNRGSGCCCSGNCFSSSDVGKRVWEKLKSVNKILLEGNFDVVVEKTPRDFVDVINVEANVGFESKLDDVWRCLRDDNLGIIGIYGMPGIGKTTLLKKIEDELVRRQEFQEVIWVSVSREANLDAIQNVILKQTKKNTNRGEDRDMERLLGSRKFILLLDDLWERLDLSKFGVSLSNVNGSKIIFTTRSEQVCDEMKAQVKLKLKCLPQEEALELFRIKAGVMENLADSTINAEFCQGLPLALVAVGQAMTRMGNRSVWEHALSKLQNYPSRLPGMDHIFRIIEPSFESLEDNILKECFVYSSLLPDVIRKDELIKLWIGEGILDTSSKKLGDYIINRLKVSCLLEGDELNDFVWMHSVIRAFGLWVAREHGKKENKFLVQEQRSEKWTKAVRISIYGQIDVVPDPVSPSPQLQTLLIRYTNLTAFPTDLGYMNALGVLDLSKNRMLAGLTSSIGSLLNLHYLNLSFTSIKELPVGAINWAKLKILLLDYTENFRFIQKGSISRLSSLQVFSKLGNEIFDDTSLLEELKCIEHISDVNISLFSSMTVERVLNSTRLQSWIRNLSLKKVENCSIPVSVLSKMVHLEELVVDDCKYLRFESEDTQYYVLNILSLQIRGCSIIKDLRWLVFAPRLQILDLRNCESLLEIIGSDFESEEIKEIDERLGILSNLKKLYLENLPHLQHICHQGLHLPVLENIVVHGCPNLSRLPFHLHSAKRLRDIKGSKSWWDHLNWEEVAVKEVFDSKFQVSEFQEVHDSISRTDPPRVDWQQELTPLSIEAGSSAGSGEANPPHQFVHHSEITPSNTEEKSKAKSALRSPIGIFKRKSDRRQAETAPSNTKGKGKSLLKSPIGIKRKSLDTASLNTKEKMVLESLSPIGIKNLGKIQPMPFTYKELEKATDGFSDNNRLGEGGFGIVYKGMLSNGEMVAIKRYKNEPKREEEEFLAEIETIARIHHRNIIKLVGYCQNKTNRLLVFEFHHNNSLRFQLHDSKLIIDWSIRMKIALGTAKGLTYLHEHCEPRIIHRDIKPDNILLNYNFEPKIAGFGIAVVFPDSECDEIDYESVAGTYGYLAPEYIRSGRLTVKADVFAFGVVLLELITGERPNRPYIYGTYKENLVLWVKSILKEGLKTGNYYTLIDPKLEQNYDKDEMERMICCAAACVYKPANLRPQMSQIVEALKGNIPLAGIWRQEDDTFLHDGSPFGSSTFLHDGSPFGSSPEREAPMVSSPARSSCAEEDLEELHKYGR